MIKAVEYCTTLPLIMLTHDNGYKTLARWSDLCDEWRFEDGGRGVNCDWRAVNGSQMIDYSTPSPTPDKRVLIVFVDTNEDEAPLLMAWKMRSELDAWCLRYPANDIVAICCGDEIQHVVTHTFEVKL